MNRKDERPVMQADDEESWKKVVQRSDTHLVVVDCYLEWCGTCDAVQPLLQKCFFEYMDSDDRYATIDHQPYIFQPIIIWYVTCSRFPVDFNWLLQTLQKSGHLFKLHYHLILIRQLKRMGVNRCFWC